MLMREKMVDLALDTLQRGLVVVVPTETVYGLAADAYNDQAVAHIYGVKGRPSFNPLILHYSSIERMVEDIEFDERFLKLAEVFWPGPLTLVMPKKVTSRASSLATAGLDTLAVRVPSHPVMRTLLERYPNPLAAPSANPSMRISPTHLEHVQAYFKDEPAIGVFLEGGKSTVGLESSVLDLTGAIPQLLRPGVITREAIEHVIGSILEGDHTASIKAPGQMKKHYAPSIPLRLNALSVAHNEALLAFGAPVPQGALMTLNLSEKGDLLEAASQLFRFLHTLDRPEFAAIAVMPIPNIGVGRAINDRLQRASAHENEVSL